MKKRMIDEACETMCGLRERLHVSQGVFVG